MSAAKLVLLLLLAMPVAELAVFIVVAATIGLGPAFALLIATSVAGGLVLRYAGRAQMSRFRTAWGEGGAAAIGLDSGSFLTLLAGILLLLPGFITDLLGLMLLVPRLRQWIGKTATGAMGRHGRAASADPVVDLKPGEWRQVPEGRLADRRNHGETDEIR